MGLVGVLTYSGLNLASVDLPTWPEFKTQSGFSRTMQRVLGLNWLAARVAEAQVRAQLSKVATGQMTVHVTPFSALDMWHGKARRVEVKGRDVLVGKAFYIHRLTLQTDPRTPLWIDLKSGRPLNPVDARLSMTVTEDGINRSFQTPVLQKRLQRIRVPLFGMGSQQLRLLNSQVDFQPQRIQFSSQLAVKGMADNEALPVTMETAVEPDPETGGLHFYDVTVSALPGSTDSEQLQELVAKTMTSAVNPEKLLHLGSETKVSIQSVQVNTDTLVMTAQVRIVPAKASSG